MSYWGRHLTYPPKSDLLLCMCWGKCLLVAFQTCVPTIPLIQTKFAIVQTHGARTLIGVSGIFVLLFPISTRIYQINRNK